MLCVRACVQWSPRAVTDERERREREAHEHDREERQIHHEQRERLSLHAVVLEHRLAVDDDEVSALVLLDKPGRERKAQRVYEGVPVPALRDLR